MRSICSVGLVGLAVSACTTFPDVSTVLDLRVLAAQTDPSDVFLTVTGLPADRATPVDPSTLGIDPASIRVIHLRPLIADPPAAAAGRTVTWTLSACPNAPYGPTPPGSVMGGGGTDPGGGANNTVGSTLCDGAANALSLPERTFGADEPADVLFTPDALIAAFKSDVYLDQFGHPHGGFDLGMPVNLEITATDGVQTAKAVKRVTFWAEPWPDQQPNQIPALLAVDLFTDRNPDTFELADPAGTLGTETPTPVSRTGGLWLRPQYTENVTDEMYAPTVISRVAPYEAVEAASVQERIRYAFYATAGHFDPARTVNQLIPGAVGIVHLESHYIPPDKVDDVPVDAATGLRLVTVWVVVRDDRGGESWLEGRLALDP